MIATCRRAEEESYLLALGATNVVNVTHTDYVTRVRELTAGEGVRFVFNGVGGDTLAADADVTAPFGEIQAYGYVAGKKPFDLFRVKHSIAIKTFSADDFFATPMQVRRAACRCEMAKGFGLCRQPRGRSRIAFMRIGNARQKTVRQTHVAVRRAGRGQRLQVGGRERRKCRPLAQRGEQGINHCAASCLRSDAASARRNCRA